MPRPLFVRHADALYAACEEAIRAGRIDARSKIGDAVLDYRQYRDEMARDGVTADELHNREVIRTGRGMILLPTNVEVDVSEHIGGLP